MLFHRIAINFYILILYLETLLNPLTLLFSFTYSIKFSLFTAMSSVDNGSLSLSFQSFVFDFLSCLIALIKTSNTVPNRRDTEHFCPNLRRKATFYHEAWCYLMVFIYLVSYFLDVPYQNEEVVIYPRLPRGFFVEVPDSIFVYMQNDHHKSS